MTCRQFVAGRGAGSALELALTFVCLDDLRRGSRYTEQLLAEMIGRMNDMNVLWIHRVGASRVVVTAYLDGGCTCLGLARTKTAQQEGGRLIAASDRYSLLTYHGTCSKIGSRNDTNR